MKQAMGIVIAALLLVPLVAQAGRGNGNRGAGASCNLATQLSELTSQHVGDRERADLIFMREEEKLARDVFLSLYERWGLAIFRQIGKAESRHMALALVVADKYGLGDPVGDNGLGVFTNPDLQALYERLAADGAASVESALLVGAAIEDLDIRDLQRSLERANNEDLELLYQNLMKGSRNHLRAFTSVLERYGISYEPVYLLPEEYQEIIDSPREKGVVDAEGEPRCGGGPPR
jgi:hypothetical protein